MESLSSLKKDKVYHLKYSMESTFNGNSGVKSEVTEVEVFSSLGKMAIYDQRMNVFGDEENIFVVLPDIKKIYWNNSDPKIFNETDTYKKFLEIQLALLSSAKDISCSESENGLIMITIIPDSNFTKQTGLQIQQVTYSLKQDRIMQVENKYNGTRGIINQKMIYKKMDFDSPHNIISPIRALFKNNELKPIYKGFEIIDNRKNQ
ncbi:MAG: hypothetical protein GYB37_15230 [Algicola sp.]|nr:hypothetical protein [Algicola sp.]